MSEERHAESNSHIYFKKDRQVSTQNAPIRRKNDGCAKDARRLSNVKENYKYSIFGILSFSSMLLALLLLYMDLIIPGFKLALLSIPFGIISLILRENNKLFAIIGTVSGFALLLCTTIVLIVSWKYVAVTWFLWKLFEASSR